MDSVFRDQQMPSIAAVSHTSPDQLMEQVTSCAAIKRWEVVRKDSEQKGFVVLKRRWLVERTFGWLSYWGGLLRERAGRLGIAAGRLACVACLRGRQRPQQSSVNSPSRTGSQGQPITTLCRRPSGADGAHAPKWS